MSDTFSPFNGAVSFRLTATPKAEKNNRGVLKPICKLKFKMQTAVREDLLRYLQSGKAVEEK